MSYLGTCLVDAFELAFGEFGLLMDRHGDVKFTVLHLARGREVATERTSAHTSHNRMSAVQYRTIQDRTISHVQKRIGHQSEAKATADRDQQYHV